MYLGFSSFASLQPSFKSAIDRACVFILSITYLQNIAVGFNGNTVDDAFNKRPDEAYVIFSSRA